MAIDEYGIEFLAAARASGVSFRATGTMGRQAVLVSRRALQVAYTVAGLAPPKGIPRVTRGWIDPILRDFGATDIVSVDASEYEGACLVHDLNQEIPDSLSDRFSAVVDVGTLEHVFNFPMAIQNYMRMVAVGGHLLLTTPTNNEAGHGFYQFSPELFYRTLSPAYGFMLEEMLLLEVGARRPRWYAVSDPAMIGSRAQFRSQQPTYLFIRARRLGPINPFDGKLQQSDYVAHWQGAARPVAGGPVGGQLLRRIATKLPPLKKQYLHWFTRRRSLYVRAKYTKIPSHFRPVSGPATAFRDADSG